MKEKATPRLKRRIAAMKAEALRLGFQSVIQAEEAGHSELIRKAYEKIEN